MEVVFTGRIKEEKIMEKTINKECLLNMILELPVKKKVILRRNIDLMNFKKLKIRITRKRIMCFCKDGNVNSAFELNDGDFDNVINHFYTRQ